MSIKVPKYFPIISDTSCRTKWAWSTIILNNGTTSSCCRASTSLIGENFDDFHNTEKKIKSRELMLKGLWPADGCETCESIEKAGGFSDRQFQNQIPGIYPVELDSNPNATRVSPSILEVFFSNACNLKCVYCSAKYSSSIQSENKKFGGAIIEKNNFEFKNDNDIHKENFIKFLSDSRDWAFTYIEDVQKGLEKFISNVEPEIVNFDENSSTYEGTEYHDFMKRISEQYKELKKLMPTDTISKDA